ncbi:MAG: hypothetical protein NVS9B12_06570 [Vulcanimicrobiaceae bacterium]
MDPFEQSADMRLLELHRKALGKSAPPPSQWLGSSDTRDALAVEDVPAPALTGARLNVDVAATPNQKLIPGAVVTVTLAVHNIGDRPVSNVLVAVPVPGEAAYRAGSLEVDRRALSEADAALFLGSGFTIAHVSAGQRVGFTWKISVGPGTAPLLISPRVLAGGAGVVGGTPILMARGTAASSARLPDAYLPPAREAERPFYELDEREEAEAAHELAAAPPPAAAPLVMMPDILEEPAPAAPLPEPVPQLLEPRLYCTLDTSSLNLLKKLFASESFGQVPHYILQNGLACSLGSEGRDYGIRAHLSKQGGLLSRALLVRKLNKPMRVGDFAGGAQGIDLGAANTPMQKAPPYVLYMELKPADVDFSSAADSGNPLESFIRNRQLAVVLQAQRVATQDDALKVRAESLLAGYAAAARAAINRTFIKAKLDKNFDPFGGANPAADALAHELIEVLGILVGA